ncbi:unnamed protein product [Dovyalis caffra]|uniref:Uncharacterized protein n=1 Tax=Dovyalis caffra TaxID=77055 RepID=A0AAV1RGL6_9ROSI|nr:unnamed protein product [Dovyalis caffra]
MLCMLGLDINYKDRRLVHTSIGESNCNTRIRVVMTLEYDVSKGSYGNKGSDDVVGGSSKGSGGTAKDNMSSGGLVEINVGNGGVAETVVVMLVEANVNVNNDDAYEYNVGNSGVVEANMDRSGGTAKANMNVDSGDAYEYNMDSDGAIESNIGVGHSVDNMGIDDDDIRINQKDIEEVEY